VNDINVALVGPGAIGERHLRALATGGGRVNAVVSRYADEAATFAAEHGIDLHTTDLDAVLARSDVDAVVLASPSPFHHDQALACLRAGKPVLSEIPYALDLAGALELVEVAEQTGLQATVAHSFRFAAPYREIRRRVEQGRLDVRHVTVQQLSLRHENIGWTGRKRDWVDDLLWHHGGHVIDLALWFLDAPDVEVLGVVGPDWPGNGTYMDVSATLVAPDRDLASFALSYHSRSSGGSMVIIGEDETYTVRDGALVCNGETELESGGYDAMMAAAWAAQDGEFLDSIRENRAPAFDLRDALPAMRAMAKIAATRVPTAREQAHPDA
jgi:2-hydroxy-4-carboxymuconate semialdehyde hemiacetal dehydrogenase